MCLGEVKCKILPHKNVPNRHQISKTTFQSTIEKEKFICSRDEPVRELLEHLTYSRDEPVNDPLLHPTLIRDKPELEPVVQLTLEL